MKRIVLMMTAFVLLPALGWAAWTFTAPMRARELEVFGEVPPFTLTESSGKPITKADLDGKVWVASFIFTHCRGTCPMVIHSMQRIQKDFGKVENLRLVSFSVDPGRDTPQVLTEYAKKVGADTSKWFFATGKKRDIHGLIQNGFRLGSESESWGKTDADTGGVTHSSRVVLVDVTGNIRGYYDGMKPDEVDQLMKDLPGVLHQSLAR